MQFQIRQLIIWPKKPDLPPRVVAFQENCVNVITGASRTGKSAIIPIVDYCLGASKCTIPVDTIRDACAWFGILVQLGKDQMLLARKGPENQRSTGEMYVESGKVVSIPPRIDKGNTNVDVAKQTLNELAGLTDLPLAQRSEGFVRGSRPSFRDLVSFVFQPQNVVANSDVLFFKTGQSEYRQRLKQIFPYALGSVDADTLALMHVLSETEKELKRKAMELKSVTSVSMRWKGEVASLLDQALKYGVLSAGTEVPESWSDQLRLLRTAAAQEDGADAPTTAALVDTSEKLRQLHKTENTLSFQIATIQSRLATVGTLGDSVDQYQQTLTTRKDRLSLSAWLAASANAGTPCPFCGESGATVKQALTALAEKAQGYAEESTRLAHLTPALDRERLALSERLKELREELDAIRRRRRDLEQSSEAAKHAAFTLSARSRFIGAIQEGLKTYEEIGVDRDLVAEVETLKRKVADLRARIRAADERERTKRALQGVSKNIGEIIKGLDSEWPDAPAELVVDDLTVRISRVDRYDYLWEMGSGSNWLSYHVATTLALHEHFLATPRSPVPSFQVYDQPSQVYFPKTFRPDDEVAEAEAWKDVDVQAVRKVFATFSQFLTSIVPLGFQIIVLDHAPEDFWADLPNARTVEVWRGRSLVPAGWID